jgi:thiol-disulfide isomerase/thioredoxin
MERKRWSRWGGEALAVLLALVAVGIIQTRHHLGGGTRPAATLQTLDGAPVSLESLRGRPTVLYFWAPWCAICKASSGNVSRLARWGGERLRVVAVASAFGQVAEVREAMRAQGIDYPVLLGDEATQRAFAVDAFPTTYFLDEEGRVKRSVAGYTTTLGLLARALF